MANEDLRGWRTEHFRSLFIGGPIGDSTSLKTRTGIGFGRHGLGGQPVLGFGWCYGLEG